MVNIRGVNVYPVGIESVVRRFPEVVEFRSTVSHGRRRCGRWTSRSRSRRSARTDVQWRRSAWRSDLREALGLTVPVHVVPRGHAAAVRDEGPPVRRGGEATDGSRSDGTRDRARVADEMPGSDPDVVVIGGGPAGSTVSTLIAQQGLSRPAVRARALSAVPHRRVADPRDLLGAEAARTCCRRCSRATSSRSTACSSSTRSGKLSAPFYFWDNKPHECSQTWQVVRSEFDQMMLDNAREHGVDVHEGVARARRAVRGRPRRRRADQGRGRPFRGGAREGRRRCQRPERPDHEPPATCASGIRC